MQIETTNYIKARLGFGVNGEVQKFFTNECASHMIKYVPRDQGFLSEKLVYAGNDYVEYRTPYAHYQYHGELYVDPVTGKGAFYDSDYGFWSRPNTKKISSGKKLKYHTPNTGSYWDKRMWSSEGKDIIKNTENYMKKG